MRKKLQVETDTAAPDASAARTPLTTRNEFPVFQVPVGTPVFGEEEVSTATDQGDLEAAREVASDADPKSEAVRLELDPLVRRAAYERLRALQGSEPLATDVRRRRKRTV